MREIPIHCKLCGKSLYEAYTPTGNKDTKVLQGIFRPEPYSSQCPPDAGAVSKEYAVKQNRICRGLYVKNGTVWNADSVGAYNILRLYLDGEKKKVPPYAGLSNPVVVKVAV